VNTRGETNEFLSHPYQDIKRKKHVFDRVLECNEVDYTVVIKRRD